MTLNWFVDACPLCVIFRVILDAVINEDLDVVFEQHRQRVYSRQLLHSQLTKTIAQVVPGVCETPNQAFNKLAAALRLPSAILCQSFRPKPRIDNRKQMAGPVCLSPFAYPPLAYPNRGPTRICPSGEHRFLTVPRYSDPKARCDRSSSTFQGI